MFLDLKIKFRKYKIKAHRNNFQLRNIKSKAHRNNFPLRNIKSKAHRNNFPLRNIKSKAHRNKFPLRNIEKKFMGVQAKLNIIDILLENNDISYSTILIKSIKKITLPNANRNINLYIIFP